jgi:succinyl-diaminopimelate desuccinylase
MVNSDYDLGQSLLSLVQIDSVIRDEKRICDTLAQRIEKLGRFDIDRVGNSFAVRQKERHHDKLLCLVGHLDTVPPSGENPPRIEDGRVYGLGASDMKAGLALMLGLIDFPVQNPAFDLSYVFYDGEEGPFLDAGLGPLLDQVGWLKSDVDLAICLEPSDNVLQLGCLGVLNAKVTFEGRAAHSARPWQGENAVHKAAGLLTRLAAWEPIEHRFGELCYREVISATLAQGGSARNVVPASFELNLNYRFPPGISNQQATKKVEALIAGEAKIEIVDLAPSGAIPKNNPLLDRFTERCQVPVAAKQAWTDVGRLSELGIDAINFGPGENAQAHQPTESTSIALLERGDALLRTFIDQ